MSRTYHHGKNGKERRIRVRGVRRPTDLKRLARVLIELERAQAEADAEAETTTDRQPPRRQPEGGDS